jgi:TonB-dependent receptor
VRNIFILLSLLFSIKSFGQTVITGTVADETGPLPGANVFIEGTTIGTSTDLDGKFRIVGVPGGKQRVTFSFIGYEALTMDVEVRQGTSDLGRILLSQGKRLDEVVVQGDFRGSEAKAINMTKMSTRIVNVLAADGVGKLPDRNAAEAVQRVPAVALERDMGEGRYISVRGTPTDWSASLLNGDRLPVADENGDSRTMAFDVLPTELIEYIVLSKALTPDQEGDAIGGSVNFITRTAPRKRTLVASVAGGYNAQAQRPVGSASLMWGDRSKNGKFGYIVNGNMFHRNYGTDNFQVVYGSNYNHGVNRLELRDYLGQRTTYGVNASAEYEFKPGTTVHVKGILGSMIDNERHYKTRYNWAVGAGQTILLQNIHNIMESRLMGGELGGSIRASARLSIDWKAATYHNRWGYGPVPFERGDRRNGYHVVQFERFGINFTDQVFIDPATGQEVGFDTPGAWRLKLLGNDHPSGNGDDPYNIQPTYLEELRPQDFEFSGAYTELKETWERDPIVGQLDLNFSATTSLKLKAGAKFRMKEGGRSVSLHEWLQDYDATTNAMRLTQFDTQPMDERGGFMQELGQPWRGTFMPFLTDEAMANFHSFVGDSLREREMNSQHPHYEEWVGGRYTYREYVTAGYVMGEWDLSRKVQLIGGLRVEHTALEMEADTVLEGYFDLEELRFVYPVEQVQSQSSYLSFLPSLHVNWKPNDKMNLRFAFTRSLRRPNFNETKPGAPVIDFTNLEFNTGNRMLRPSHSYNFDLMAEYFFGNIGMVSAGVFGKLVTDHIFATMSADVDQRTGIIFKSYQNADASYVVGAEAQFNRRFDFLPGFAKGFGINANYTYIHSRMNVPGRSRPQPLPRQADHLFNIALFYELHGVQARLALNYRGPYLMELNLAAIEDSDGNRILLHDNTDYDIFMDDFLSMDFSASYQIGKRWTVFAEANNLLNWPFLLYRGNDQRPMKLEYYSARGQVGVRFSI